MLTFPYVVKAPANPQTGSFIITIKIDVPTPDKGTPANVIDYIRSISLKQDLSANWMRQNAANCGLEVFGGPRPVLENTADRGSKILAYEQDFKLCNRI